MDARLAALYPAVLAPAPDVDEPGWQILYLDLPTGQCSWHIHPRDADLYGHVEHVGQDDPRAQWDGHTTPEKYQRIADQTAALARSAYGIKAMTLPPGSKATLTVEGPGLGNQTQHWQE